MNKMKEAIEQQDKEELQTYAETSNRFSNSCESDVRHMDIRESDSDEIVGHTKVVLLADPDF